MSVSPSPHYFDFNATTPLCPAARQAWQDAQDEAWHNPSSAYRAGAAVHARLDQTREGGGARLGASPGRVVFNSGATEGNNGIMRHLVSQASPDAGVLVSPLEHPSVLEPARRLFGDRLQILPLNAAGQVDPGALDRRLAQSPPVALVSVMAAHNVTGIIQPWEAIARVCRRHGVPYHCDASQWLGKYPADGLGDCAWVTGCAHKLGGPKGVGFILLPDEDCPFGQLFGGYQQRGRRAGTEDWPNLAAFFAAWEDRQALAPDAAAADHRAAFEQALIARIPEVRILGLDTPRLWNTSAWVMPRHRNTRWIARMDKAGFQIAGGAACSSNKDHPDDGLRALGVLSDEADRVIRVSGGWETGREAWLALADAFGRVMTQLDQEATSPSSGTRVIDLDD